jgi:hypothetical protein
MCVGIEKHFPPEIDINKEILCSLEGFLCRIIIDIFWESALKKKEKV